MAPSCAVSATRPFLSDAPTNCSAAATAPRGDNVLNSIKNVLGEPLGIALTPTGADVAVYSAHASAAYLCLYDEAGEHETDRVRLAPDDDGVHRGEVAGVARGSAIRLSRRWPLPALAGPSVRHLQAVGRPLCGRDRSPLQAAPFDVRAWRGQRTVRPQMHSVAGGGGRAGAAARRMGPHDSLRTQSTRLHPPAAGYPGARARSLRWTRAARGRRASGGARRHQRRDHAVRRIRR